MNHIVLDKLGKSFGGVRIFENLSLTIEEGEFVVLVGPSGCGKSTLLRLIAGLEDITSGDLLIKGERVNTLPAKRRDIAMVFQSYALYPHMSVSDNMSFALRLSGISKKERHARAADAAEILGLSELLDRLPRDLSGGQRQRVAMGRAIVRDPQAFLFDEPLSNLDAKLRHKMRGEIKKIHQKLGRTTIYVTHDQTEAMTMADRIVVMNDGQLEQVGSPRQLYSDPDNLFVAGFIGTPEINTFPAILKGSSVELKNGLSFPSPISCSDEVEHSVTCAIRPHHISLDGNQTNAEVLLVEPTGEGLEVQILVGAQEVTVVSYDQPAVTVGERIGVSFDAKRIFLFDEFTGERLRESAAP
jgi:multiple sugar transport system ATP-binding protein